MINSSSSSVESWTGPGPFVPEGTPFEDFFREFQDRQGPNGQRPRRSSALGSGFVISEDGDIITIDANTGTMEVDLSDEELAARRAAWTPRETSFRSGALWKYAQTVGSAEKGAVTYPGGEAEVRAYADI